MAEVDVQQALLDEIKEFINEKWKHSECELCGTDRWMIYPEPTSHAYLPVGAADSAGNTVGSSPAMAEFVPLSCTNCGNLRLIDARTFEKWRRGREQIAK